jgi:hypothetical protein
MSRESLSELLDSDILRHLGANLGLDLRNVQGEITLDRAGRFIAIGNMPGDVLNELSARINSQHGNVSNGFNVSSTGFASQGLPRVELELRIDVDNFYDRVLPSLQRGIDAEKDGRAQRNPQTSLDNMAATPEHFRFERRAAATHDGLAIGYLHHSQKPPIVARSDAYLVIAREDGYPFSPKETESLRAKFGSGIRFSGDNRTVSLPPMDMFESARHIGGFSALAKELKSGVAVSASRSPATPAVDPLDEQYNRILNRVNDTIADANRTYDSRLHQVAVGHGTDVFEESILRMYAPEFTPSYGRAQLDAITTKDSLGRDSLSIRLSYPGLTKDELTELSVRMAKMSNVDTNTIRVVRDAEIVFADRYKIEIPATVFEKTVLPAALQEIQRVASTPELAQHYSPGGKGTAITPIEEIYTRRLGEALGLDIEPPSASGIRAQAGYIVINTSQGININGRGESRETVADRREAVWDALATARNAAGISKQDVTISAGGLTTTDVMIEIEQIRDYERTHGEGSFFEALGSKRGIVHAALEAHNPNLIGKSNIPDSVRPNQAPPSDAPGDTRASAASHAAPDSQVASINQAANPVQGNPVTRPAPKPTAGGTTASASQATMAGAEAANSDTLRMGYGETIDQGNLAVKPNPNKAPAAQDVTPKLQSGSPQNVVQERAAAANEAPAKPAPEGGKLGKAGKAAGLVGTLIAVSAAADAAAPGKTLESVVDVIPGVEQWRKGNHKGAIVQLIGMLDPSMGYGESALNKFARSAGIDVPPSALEQAIEKSKGFIPHKVLHENIRMIRVAEGELVDAGLGGRDKEGKMIAADYLRNPNTRGAYIDSLKASFKAEKDPKERETIGIMVEAAEKFVEIEGRRLAKLEPHMDKMSEAIVSALKTQHLAAQVSAAKANAEPAPAHATPNQKFDIITIGSTRKTAIEWSGQGSETTAKIQAIAEKTFNVATDAGGAGDNKVDGLMGKRTIGFLKEKKFDVGLETDNQKILEALIRDPEVKKAFGTITGAGGEQIANISLQRTNNEGRGR